MITDLLMKSPRFEDPPYLAGLAKWPYVTRRKTKGFAECHMYGGATKHDAGMTSVPLV
jgi:hypothetical protein